MPDGIVENGTVLIQQGKIVAAGTKVKMPANATTIDTHGIIAPGLIDLHNHLTYNVFPRWRPMEEFGNRYDWQQKPIYNTLLESPHAGMVADGLECEMERYAEVKALSEGETSVVGSLAECLQPGAGAQSRQRRRVACRLQRIPPANDGSGTRSDSPAAGQPSAQCFSRFISAKAVIRTHPRHESLPC